MARRRKMTPERRAFINGLLEHSTNRCSRCSRNVEGSFGRSMLEAEMDQKLGYSIQNKETDEAGTVTEKRLHLRWAILILIFPVIAEVNLNHRL